MDRPCSTLTPGYFSRPSSPGNPCPRIPEHSVFSTLQPLDYSRPGCLTLGGFLTFPVRRGHTEALCVLVVSPSECLACGGGSGKVRGLLSPVGGLSRCTWEQGGPLRMSFKGGGSVPSRPEPSVPPQQGMSWGTLAENKIFLNLSAPHL